MTTNSDPATQVFLGWANSVLCEAGLLLDGLDDLQSGVALATIVDTLWPDAQLSAKVLYSEQNDGQDSCTYNMQVVLDFLDQVGVTCDLSAQDAAGGQEGALRDLLWLVALHLSVHSPGVAPCERTEEAGVRDLLEWCLLTLPGVTVDLQQGLAANLCGENLIVHLISQFCPVEEDEDAIGLLMNAMLAAEEYLGMSKYILDPLATSAGSVPERHLMMYLALLRRKSHQIEEMGPFAGQLVGSQPPDEAPWGAAGPPPPEGPAAFPSNITDPQQLLEMIGDQPLTQEMLEALQAQFGPIEIEIVDESSEESGEQYVSGPAVDDMVEVDNESGSFNVWPQQPILYDPTSNPGHGSLFAELEQAEEVERLSQEVLQTRTRGPLDEDSDDEQSTFKVLGGTEQIDHNENEASASGSTLKGSDRETHLKTGSSKRTPSGMLRPPWLSPVPFHQPNPEGHNESTSADNSILFHSTPRKHPEGMSDEEGDDQQQQNEEMDEQEYLEESQTRGESEYEEMEVNLEDLTKEEIQEILMTAQMEGIPFDPRLIDLATMHGLEFEIVMEDEDGNIIEGFPGGESMTSTNFADLVQELKIASGQDMEMSIQYDSGMGTATGTTISGAVTDPHVNIDALQLEIQQHLVEGVEMGAEGNLPNAPTTSLDDLHNLSGDEVEVLCTHGEDVSCTCPGKGTAQSSRRSHVKQTRTQQHFHNSDKRLGEQKTYSSAQYFQLRGEGTTPNAGVDASRESDSDSDSRRPDSEKSSDIDTDNETEERRKFSSNRSDKSFSSNTSIDGVIDTRADMDESEEEIVITMEVPGIPTEDGGFIIDMSKMFIPISIPGQGDQEITVEIDPSGFDFSSMVQNEDGSIEVDIEREVHNWMAKSASKFVHYSSSGLSPNTDNVVYSTPNKASETKVTGQYDVCDAEVNSAIRAAITEQLHFPNKSSSDDSPSHTGPTIRPLSETPPQQDTSSRSVGSSSSLFDVSPAEDEVLQLLEQIGKQGQEMKKELEQTQQREICLFQEKSQEEVRLAATVTLLEKELRALRTENKKLYRDINTGKNTNKRDQGMVQRLESAMEDLQTRIHTLQRENTDLKKVNATLERRSRMVMHKSTMTERNESDHKLIQAGTSMFKLRSRGIQTMKVNTADFSMQLYGHQFMRNAVTSTQDPIFRSLRSKNLGTQTEAKILVDRGVIAMSTKEKLWIGTLANAATQVRAVSKQHEAVITRKVTRDASTITVTVEPERGISPIPKLNLQPTVFKETMKPDTKYPWHPARNQEQQRRTSTPVKANQPIRPMPIIPAQRPTLTSSSPKGSQVVEKSSQQTHGDSPTMENSATESMDTDEEPEGPDKWQRLSSTPLKSDPTVIKLQRSLASATLENDLLQTKMKKAKQEMSNRLGEWADLLAASKVELKQAKHDAVDLAGRQQNNTSLETLQQKIAILEQTLLSAQQENHNLTSKLESTGSSKPTVKTFDLESENNKLKATLDKIKQERDQLVKVSRELKDFSHLRQHHRHSTEAVTELESSLVGMASDRQHLQKEVQTLRDEYQHLKQGMELMEHYFTREAAVQQEETPSVVEDAVRETQAVVSVLQHSDKVTQRSEAVLNALKDHEQDEVVVIPAGGVEGSLHKHISALAARIQTELGIKVQLVGEVDPAEILGASIHSQEGRTTSTPTPSQEDLTGNAVEHLFQSVRPEGLVKPKGSVMDLQDVEDIIARAIPSPREASRDSSPSPVTSHPQTPRHQPEPTEKTDFESLDAAELRRKRLGMFVESYTKPRDVSPESHLSSPRSPRGRSPSPGSGSSRRSSPLARPELTVEDLEVRPQQAEPSTDHHMKMYRESRHQIQSQPPWAGSSSQQEQAPATSAKHQDNTQKPEVMRKKLNSAPLLPSKFNLTSVGVPKSSNVTPTSEESPPQQQGHAWATPRWRPFSRLGKSSRLKQEPRPPSRGPSRAEMAAEAASIQDDILSRYAGGAADNPPPQILQHPASDHRTASTVKASQQQGRTASRNSQVDSIQSRQNGVEYDHQNGPTRTIDTDPPAPHQRQSYPTANENRYTHDKPRPVSRSAAPTPTGGVVFGEADYTDYLLSKYGGEDDSPETSSQTADRPAPPLYSSPDNDRVSTSDVDSLTQGAAHGRTWANGHSPVGPGPETRPSPTSRTRASAPTPSQTSRSSRTSNVRPSRQSESPRYSTRPEESPSRTDRNADYYERTDHRTRLSSSSLSPSPRPAAYTNTTSRPSSTPSARPELYSRSTTGTSSIRNDPPRSSTRPHSNPPLRSEASARSVQRSDKPWHTSSTSSSSSSYSSYPITDPTTHTTHTTDSARSYYTDYLDKHDAEDRYWTEPKPYDYRHSLSTAWKEPRKHDNSTWRDADRLWPDSSDSSSGQSAFDSYTKPTSRAAYESYSSTSDHQSAPYQTMADRYRFSSSRAETDRDPSGRHGYYGSTSTPSPSAYSQSYDRSSATPPTRSYVSRSEDLSPLDNRSLGSSRFGSPDNGISSGSPAPATSGHDFRDEDPYMSSILNRYSVGGRSSVTLEGLGPAPTGRLASTRSGVSSNRDSNVSSSSYLADKYLNPLSTPSYDPYTSSSGLSPSSGSPGFNRYTSPTSDPYSSALGDIYTRGMTSDPYSRRADLTSGYGRYSTSSEAMGRPGDAGRSTGRGTRRSEIEDLLNKYAPLH